MTPFATQRRIAEHGGRRDRPSTAADTIATGVLIEYLLQHVPDYETRHAMSARDPMWCSHGFRFLVPTSATGFVRRRNVPLLSTLQMWTTTMASHATTYVVAVIHVKAELLVAWTLSTALSKIGNQVCCIYTRRYARNDCISTRPRRSILTQIQTGNAHFVHAYSHFSMRASRTTYANTDAWHDEQTSIEEKWPEYAAEHRLLRRPGYFTGTKTAENGRTWLTAHQSGAQHVQQRRQHHVHVLCASGVRNRHTHCKRTENTEVCKHKRGFPKASQMALHRAVVLCTRLAATLNLAASGRLNVIGSFLGPRNDLSVEWIHPALPAAHSGHSYVQIPYRPQLQQWRLRTVCAIEY